MRLVIFGFILCFIFSPFTTIIPAYVINTEPSLSMENSINVKATELSEEEIEDLELYIENIKGLLDKTTSYDKTIEIFKEVVIELDRYELLPDNMSVEEAQKLVTGKSGKEKTIFNLHTLLGKIFNNNLFSNMFKNLLKRYNNKNKENDFICTQLDDNENFNCLTIGHTSNTKYWRQEGNHYNIILGWAGIKDQNYYDDPAKGWIYTNGDNGVKNWNGRLYGDVYQYVYEFDTYNMITYHEGIRDFKGLKICLLDFYIGQASHVKIKYF